jgi:hypothetical protein
VPSNLLLDSLSGRSPHRRLHCVSRSVGYAPAPQVRCPGMMERVRNLRAPGEDDQHLARERVAEGPPKAPFRGIEARYPTVQQTDRLRVRERDAGGLAQVRAVPVV